MKSSFFSHLNKYIAHNPISKYWQGSFIRNKASYEANCSVQIYRAKTQHKVYDLTEDVFFCKSFKNVRLVRKEISWEKGNN